MNKQKEEILSDEETEILQEIMNIAFGQSAANLAEVIETQVVLSVPFIKIMQVKELPDYFKKHVKDHKNINLVEQKFWGRFKGDALLVFSSGAGKELVTLLQHEVTMPESESIDILEREMLMEVGNILIGACVGKIAELLKDVITYTPPILIVGKDYEEAIANNRYGPDNTAIVLKTDFSFEDGDVSGFLFLVTSNNSIEWLREALKIFIAQYE